MLRLTLFASLVLAALAANPRFDGRIVNGKPGNIEDFPYQVSIMYDNEHNCGGSIIGKRHIVTAAHCVVGFDDADQSIRVGSSYHDEGGQVIRFKKSISHKDYSEDTYDSDIAVVELEEDIIFGEGVQPITLKNVNDVADGTMAVISGWGDLKEGGETPKQLQYIMLPTMSDDDCKKYYKPQDITKNMLCAGYVDGTGDSCQGDSGGPLAVDGELLGVVSWGYGCAAIGYPGVYASVPRLRSFIQENTGI